MRYQKQSKNRQKNRKEWANVLEGTEKRTTRGKRIRTREKLGRRERNRKLKGGRQRTKESYIYIYIRRERKDI